MLSFRCCKNYALQHTSLSRDKNFSHMKTSARGDIPTSLINAPARAGCQNINSWCMRTLKQCGAKAKLNQPALRTFSHVNVGLKNPI